MKKLIPLLILIVATGSSLSLASCKKEKNNVTPAATAQPDNSTALTAFEKETITYTREEEKMARDVYNVMLAKWNINIFSNISASEQKHMDAIQTLLTAYNLPDPVGNNAPGVFTNAEIQQLYNSLVAKGNISETDAMITGLTIEDMDIYDLQQAIQQVQKQDIKTVLGNLLRASKNHMREFYTQLQNRGGVYSPQYITQQEYNDIINSPKEHGGQ
ncbi:MAG TPA: DUF2202 domain-containing protein [Flavipsychrobacter sp.]